MNAILAIDQSTSGTKALLFSTDGQLIDQTALPHQQHYPQPGWVEHDAEEIYQNTLQVIHQLIEQNPAADLTCLSITNQRETFVVFEKTSGKPLYHAIVWQCRRGDPLCQELIAAGHSDTVQQITGLKIDTYFPASKISWLLQEEPEIKGKLASGEALLGTIETYLIYRLTNGTVFAADHTNACRTLLYDIGKLAWSDTLCDLFGIPHQALAEVRESSAHFGDTDLNGYLSQAIPIYGVMGDSQAALFAQRCFEPGSAKVTFGTGSSVLLNIGEQLRLSDNGIVTTLGWVYQGQPTYAFEGITNFTGAIIAWLQNQMQLIDSPEQSEMLATQVEDNSGVYLVPAFVGLSAPYWKPSTRAAIVGLTPHSTRQHVVRAGLEAIAYRIRDVLDVMRQDAAVDLQVVHGDGGMVRNQFLMQFAADMVGLTLRASELPELSALGAVLSGLLGLGLYDSLAALNGLPHSGTDFIPAMPDEQRDTYYAGWQAAVNQVI